MTPQSGAMQEAFIDELGFWRDYCAEARNRPWLEHLANCDLLIEPKIQKLLDQLGLPHGATVRALDIGSGPLSVLGRNSPVYPINLTGIDPLADEYAGLLAEQNLRRRYPVLPWRLRRLIGCFPLAISTLYSRAMPLTIVNTLPRSSRTRSRYAATAASSTFRYFHAKASTLTMEAFTNGILK